MDDFMKFESDAGFQDFETRPLEAITHVSELEEPGRSPAGQDVPRFIMKLWNLVEQPDYQELICWSQDGRSFVVSDYHEFARKVLPRYFKHSNFNSFVRQLNLYGFRKLAKVDRGSLARADLVEPIEFFHTNFRRGQPNLLQHMQRKANASKTVDDHTVKAEDVHKVMKEIQDIRNKHDQNASLIQGILKENEKLHQEMDDLKRRHSRQQFVLNKLIRFMASVLYATGLPTGRKRRLMLTGVEEPEEGSSAPTQKLTRVEPTPAPSTLAPYEVSPIATPTVDVRSLLDLVESPPSVSTSVLPVGGNVMGGVPEGVPSHGTGAVLSDFTLEDLPASKAPLMHQPQIPHAAPPMPVLQAAISWPDHSSVVNHLDEQQANLDSVQETLSSLFNLDQEAFTDFVSGLDFPIPSDTGAGIGSSEQLLKDLQQEQLDDRDEGNAELPLDLDFPPIIGGQATYPPRELSVLERLQSKLPPGAQPK